MPKPLKKKLFRDQFLITKPRWEQNKIQFSVKIIYKI